MVIEQSATAISKKQNTPEFHIKGFHSLGMQPYQLRYKYP